MDNDKAAQVIGIPEGFQFPLPLHDSPVIRMRSVSIDGDTLRYDPQTAHARAGDPSYEKSIPESCGLCQAEAIAAAAYGATSPKDAT